MSNTITAFFKGRVGVCESLYQYDYGMVMVLDDVDFGSVFEAYFQTTGEEEAIPVIGRNNRIAIPDDCLSRPGIVTLHIPVHTGENDSEVEYIITFRVIGRAKPVYEGTASEYKAIANAIAVLQNIQGDVNAWLDEHPEATTTVQEGSLVEASFSEALKLKTIKDYVTPEMFGAVGDGETDDTEAIQEAIDSEKPVWFSPKTYLVSASANGDHVALDAISGMVLIGNGATIKLKANSYTRYRILRMRTANNIFINGLNIIGDKAEHEGSTGEQGYGFSVTGSKNVHIDNCSASYCWGDGLNIAATYAPLAASIMCHEVYVNNFESHHNRRQGISVEGCDGFYLDNAYIHDIAGTAPQAAIDFEPSAYLDEETQIQSKYEYIDNVFVSNLKAENTDGAPIYIEDLHSTQEGRYFFNNITLNSFRFSSLVTDSAFGSIICMENVIIKQRTGRVCIECNIKNANTHIYCGNLSVERAGTAGILLLDNKMDGTFCVNGLKAIGGSSDQKLIDLTYWNENETVGVVIDGLNADTNFKYMSTANENKAQSGAAVRLANDIIDSSKMGWFNVNNIANVYYFGSDKTANSFIQLPYIYDGYEYTVINESDYQVNLEREDSSRPKIYFDSISTPVYAIQLAPGSMARVKFSKKMGAWYLVNSVGTVTSVS